MVTLAAVLTVIRDFLNFLIWSRLLRRLLQMHIKPGSKLIKHQVSTSLCKSRIAKLSTRAGSCFFLHDFCYLCFKTLFLISIFWFSNNGHLAICHDSVKEKLGIIAASLNSSTSHYQLLSGSEFHNQYPGLKFDESFHALHESNGIVIKADRALAALKVGIFKKRNSTCLCIQRNFLN